MGTTLSPNQLALYLALDEILWKEWDPISVSRLEGEKNEYHAYLPHIFSLALKHASAEDIAQYLHEIVSERMELQSTIEMQMPIAQKIRNLAIETLGKA